MLRKLRILPSGGRWQNLSLAANEEGVSQRPFWSSHPKNNKRNWRFDQN